MLIDFFPAAETPIIVGDEKILGKVNEDVLLRCVATIPNITLTLHSQYRAKVSNLNNANEKNYLTDFT